MEIIILSKESETLLFILICVCISEAWGGSFSFPLPPSSQLRWLNHQNNLGPEWKTGELRIETLRSPKDSHCKALLVTVPQKGGDQREDNTHFHSCGSGWRIRRWRRTWQMPSGFIRWGNRSVPDTCCVKFWEIPFLFTLRPEVKLKITK